MSVTPIGHKTLTKADVSTLLARGYDMVDRGLAGGCAPIETDECELVVALLDPSHETLLYAFGKDQGWYYVTGSDGALLAQGRLIDDVLVVLPQ